MRALFVRIPRASLARVCGATVMATIIATLTGCAATARQDHPQESPYSITELAAAMRVSMWPITDTGTTHLLVGPPGQEREFFALSNGGGVFKVFAADSLDGSTICVTVIQPDGLSNNTRIPRTFAMDTFEKLTNAPWKNGLHVLGYWKDTDGTVSGVIGYK